MEKPTEKSRKRKDGRLGIRVDAALLERIDAGLGKGLGDTRAQLVRSILDLVIGDHGLQRRVSLGFFRQLLENPMEMFLYQGFRAGLVMQPDAVRRKYAEHTAAWFKSVWTSFADNSPERVGAANTIPGELGLLDVKDLENRIFSTLSEMDGFEARPEGGSPTKKEPQEADAEQVVFFLERVGTKAGQALLRYRLTDLDHLLSVYDVPPEDEAEVAEVTKRFEGGEDLYVYQDGSVRFVHEDQVGPPYPDGGLDDAEAFELEAMRFGSPVAIVDQQEESQHGIQEDTADQGAENGGTGT